MIELRAFKASDWTLLRRDCSRLCALAGVVREIGGMAFTAVEAIDGGEKLFGCCGIVQTGRTGTVWALFSNDLKRDHKLWMHRLTKKYLWAVIDTLDLLRVEAIVDPKIEANCRWIERLGFENKRIKEKGGEDGRDVLEYVWLRPPVVAIRSQQRHHAAATDNGDRRHDVQLRSHFQSPGEISLDSGV